MADELDIQDSDSEVDESVATLFAGLPAPVQDFLTSAAPDRIAIELSAKYSLHTDQAGEFHKNFLLMMLGVYDPARFQSELQSKGFSSETINGLITDLNAQVFVPLRDAEREMAPTPVAPPPQPPRPPVVPVMNVGAPAIAAQPPAPVRHEEIVPVLADLPAPHVATAPKPAPVAPPVQSPPIVQVSAPAIPTPAAPVARTMISDMEAMKAGTVPGPTLIAPVVAPPAPVAPSRPAAPDPLQALTPEPFVGNTPAQAPQNVPNHTELADSLKEYGIDPYREPVDEK